MILGSVVLVLVAASLLVAGLIQGADPLYVASMVVSAVAALTLLLGVRSPGGRARGTAQLDIAPGIPATALLGQADRHGALARPVGRAAVPVPPGGGGDPAGGGTAALAEARPDLPAR